MKGILLAAIAIGIGMASYAQTDSTAKERTDTIKVGGMIIIKTPGKNDDGKGDTQVTINRNRRTSSKVNTNWWIVDLGFANYSDNTNYATTAAMGFTGAGVNEEAMKLRPGKSVNVNIWMFMQRLSLIRSYVNLKYGFGVELNNYRFDDERILLQKTGTRVVLNTIAGKEVEKNKLAADYVTVPLMLNFNFTPGRKNGFGFSAGVSGGYLYSARQKFKYADDNKNKTHGSFDLNKWKVSYIGELSLGPVRLYGSMATKSMWDKGLDQTPYNVGLRFSHL
jgi:hypothetical protein